MKKILAILTISMFTNSAYAGVCDYKPSRIISAGSGLIAGTGIALKSAGLYTMTTPAGVLCLGRLSQVLAHYLQEQLGH